MAILITVEGELKKVFSPAVRSFDQLGELIEADNIFITPLVSGQRLVADAMGHALNKPVNRVATLIAHDAGGWSVYQNVHGPAVVVEEGELI